MSILGLLFAIAFYLLTSNHSLEAQTFRGLPFIQTFGSNEYQSGIQNWGVTQDSRGFLYFANNFGLLEYDGYRWQTFPTKSATKVRSVLIGEDGRIYTGSQSEFGYFSPSSKGEWEYVSLTEQLPHEEQNFDETWHIYQLQNKIYFCTFQKIFVYDGEKIKTIHSPNSLEFSFLANNRLYVQDAKTGLYMLENDELTPVPEGQFFRNKTIAAILPYSRQRLLIVTQKHGLYLYDHFQLKQLETRAHDILSQIHLNCAIRLQDGSFALGSQNKGLFLLNPKLEIEQQLNKKHGLNDHSVLSLYQDWHQNVWVGHNNGISYVELSSPFTLLDEKLEIPGSGYAAHLQQDTLFLGTNNGVYAGTYQRETGLQFKLVQNSQGQVYHISSQAGEMLMGHHNGAYRIRNLKAYPMSENTGVWQFRQLQNTQNLMLEGGYNGFSLYEYKQDLGWKWKNDFKGFNESSRIFEEDRDGAIWMAHGYKGIYKLRFSQDHDSISNVRFYNEKDGLPSKVLNNLYRINNHIVFTGETGVFRYKPDKDHFQPDTILTAIFGKGEHIQKLNQDENGKIYFIGKTKLGSIKEGPFSKWEIDTSRFFKVHKLLNDDLDYLAILDHQNILFGAKEGFIHFNPSLPTVAEVPFRVFIRKVEINTPAPSLLFAGNFWSEEKIALRQPEASIQRSLMNLIPLALKCQLLFLMVKSIYLTSFFWKILTMAGATGANNLLKSIQTCRRGITLFGLEPETCMEK